MTSDGPSSMMRLACMAVGACIGGYTGFSLATIPHNILNGSNKRDEETHIADDNDDSDTTEEKHHSATKIFTDPEAPNLEKHLPVVASEVVNLTMLMSKLVPKSKKDAMKKQMRTFIQHLDNIATVIGDIRNCEEEDKTMFANAIHDCTSQADFAFGAGKRAGKLFYDGSETLVADQLDAVSLLVADAISTAQLDVMPYVL